MKTWNSRVFIRNPIECEILKNYSQKPSFKIDPVGKLHIIHALDNGQCKVDIAKEYGVLPQTIAYIYKQKDAIIKKYSQKYKLHKQVQGMNLDRILLDWFNLETNEGRVIYMNQLRLKAQEVIKTQKEKLHCLDDWLYDFQMRHNIHKYNTEVECSPLAKEEWLKMVSDKEAKDIYFGSFTALSHRLDFKSYIKGYGTESFISLLMIANISGSDKCQLAAVGKEPFDANSNTKSLPLDYYYSEKPQIHQFVIDSYLKRWNDDLEVKGRHIYLILNVPENITESLCYKNIEVSSYVRKEYVSKISEKVILSFKHQYRRLHINQTFFPQNSQSTLVDYLHMISMAWLNVPQQYIQRLCFPPNHGSLYYKLDDNYGNHSLTDWCRENEVPIELEDHSASLEKYMFCDNALTSSNWNLMTKSTPFINEMLLQRNTPSSSAMEAFQAMKRLVSYLQGQNANSYIIQCAKYLEDNLEYAALLQMHEITKINTNDAL